MATKKPLVKRTFVDSMKNKLNYFHIRNGTGGGGRNICIMEAVSIIIGSPNATDNPPCVSDVLMSEMIGLNDAQWMTDSMRNRLKKVVPELIGSAPTTYIQDKEYNRNTGLYERTHWTLVTDESNGAYKKAETARRKLIKNAIEEEDRLNVYIAEWKTEYDGRNRKIVSKIGLDKRLDIIRAAAAIKWEDFLTDKQKEALKVIDSGPETYHLKSLDHLFNPPSESESVPA